MVSVPHHDKEPLVELAADEAVLEALQQSAFPVEFIESNDSPPEPAESDES